MDKPLAGVVSEMIVKGLDEEVSCGIDLREGGQGPILIGSWIMENNGNCFRANENGDYSATLRDGMVTVFWSKYTEKCGPCKFYHLGTGALHTPGDITAYTLPPPVWEGVDR